MPSVSVAQRRAMAIAEHEPDKLNASNRGMLKMSKSQLSDFASTKESGLPKKKGSGTSKSALSSGNPRLKKRIRK